ncbi:RNA-directed DNA polymerase [Lactococcus piscium]|jgi:RNA-directed DNA polymerase|uniref:retron St85 family RNA-directed DNA polymerase n=1 Tax=Pseudolactococcus carnosus TaxID=2749961 RepID=UPI001FB882EB|nr:retron St85 family RNA-directed DNA polymerase [Lactococcus carnosus]MCJ1995965.1 RNA-directed DNA polymerase [Lactococcus carnosus]
MKLIDNGLDDLSRPVFLCTKDIQQAIGIDPKIFYTFLNPKNISYIKIKIPKRKKGEYRELSIPSPALKNLQRWVLEHILYSFPCHGSANGFIPNKSIVTNAIPHISKEYILKMDLKDFFPNITFSMVKNQFLTMGYNDHVSHSLALLCTYNDSLPQGAPSSPYLANLLFSPFDELIYTHCSKNNLSYTRYADDLTISGGKYILNIPQYVKDILRDSDFQINNSKTLIIKKGDKKQVTGIVVNEKISIPKNYLRELRQIIYYINKYGLDSHLKKIDYKGSKYKYINSLYGKASYIKMVDFKKGIKIFTELNKISLD